MPAPYFELSDEVGLRDVIDQLWDRTVALESQGLQTPHVSVYCAGQTIPNNTLTAIQFTGEQPPDSFGMFDAAVNATQVIIRRPGLYLVTSRVRWDVAVVNGRHESFVYRNGAIIGTAPAAAVGEYDGGYPINVGASVMRLLTGDYLELIVYQNSGGNRAVYAADAHSQPKLDVTWMGS